MEEDDVMSEKKYAVGNVEDMTGGFTLPGEAGYEALTLTLAKRWGADVIRDSDGTNLSPEILDAGYDIYSTVCVIRGHNRWAEENKDKLQQTFLVTQPKTAQEDTLVFYLLEDFFAEQFCINAGNEALKYWQVYDRTSNCLVEREQWNFNSQDGTVHLKVPQKWHRYTVSFLAFRIWEEISMYNHTTNQWEKEHLMQIDPRYPETRTYLRQWVKKWCESHPHTTVVRFTSLFYNFAWIWGADERKKTIFSDWASYDFSVSPLALEEFKEKYGYELTAEDFVNKGQYQSTHIPGTKQKQDWMSFTQSFVRGFGRELVDIVHACGKKAYVFYDDSWVGLEPYNGRFPEFGFDGLIKCVFSGYEARLCAGTEVRVHELRLHPYLFPVGLGGAPTFMEGGNPKEEAAIYWNKVRRALLRVPVERIGLGGYLHLVEKFPDFVEYIETIVREFRVLKVLHKSGQPYTLPPRVAVLHTWGKLRSWTLSGHWHETYMHDLVHVLESLAGLPLNVEFLNFQDICSGKLEEFDVVINAGYVGSAWSGGNVWKDDVVVETITRWVSEGGCFLGINQPSAVEGYDTYFRMAHVLGIDEDQGGYASHGKWQFKVVDSGGVIPENVVIRGKKKLFLMDGQTVVWAAHEGIPTLTCNSFGKGYGIYLSSFEMTPENTRMLLNLILYGTGYTCEQFYLTDCPDVDCAYFPGTGEVVAANWGREKRYCHIWLPDRTCELEIKAGEMVIL